MYVGRSKFLITLAVGMLIACQDEVVQPQSRTFDANAVSTTPTSLDAGEPNNLDSSVLDFDAEGLDASWVDAAEQADAELMDLGIADAARLDASLPDAEFFPDAAPVDAGFQSDAQVLDASTTVTDSGVIAAPNLLLNTGGSTRQIGSTSGGNTFSASCNADSAIVGLSGDLDSRGWHGQVRALCAKLIVTSNPPYRITTVAVITGPTHGRLGNSPWTRACPTNQVVVGFDGRAGALVDSITFRCAAVTITGVTGNYQASVGMAYNLSPIGGSGGTPFGISDCPAGQIATGIDGRAGDNVDALGFQCSSVVAN